MLTKPEIHVFKIRLKNMMRRVNQEVNALREETLTDGDLSNVTIHQEDQSSRENDTLNLIVIGNEEHLLTELDAALTRIEQGVFGRCEVCQKPIAKDRLEAVPYSRRCIRCANAGQTVRD